MSKVLSEKELKELIDKVVQKVWKDIIIANENGTLEELLKEYELID